MVEIKEKDLVLYDDRVYEIKKLPFDVENYYGHWEEGTLVLEYFDCEDDCYYSYAYTLDDFKDKITQVWRKNENEDYICIYKGEK